MPTHYVKPIVETPWGAAQSHENIADGVDWFDTASHGGFRLSMDRFAVVLQKFPTFVPFNHSGDFSRATRVWFEEDCDWAILPFVFPELFKPEDADTARSIISSLVAISDKWAEVNRIVAA